MTTRRPSRLEAGHQEPTAPDEVEVAPEASGARLTRVLAVGALAIALVALGLTAWRALAPGRADCQSIAWGASPATADLPADWSIGATQYEADRMSVTLLGPVPQDQTTSRAVVYATVTCFPQDAAVSVTRSQAAAAAAGETVSSRTDLGDQGFTALDPSGASFIQFRSGDVVAYVAATGNATAAEAEAIASAFDRALGGSGGSAAGVPASSVGGSAAPGASTAPAASSEAIASAAPAASAGASGAPSPAAPELEAALPKTVAGTALTVDSAVGTSVLGNDAGSRAITAALRAEGRTVEDLQVAQAYDPSGAVDLSILAFRVVGMKTGPLQKIVLDTWLAATGPGVTSSTVTIGGHPFLKVDYGDGGAMSYVTTKGDMVIVIGTADAGLAAKAAAALP